jgi:hypothetical protein
MYVQVWQVQVCLSIAAMGTQKYVVFFFCQTCSCQKYKSVQCCHGNVHHCQAAEYCVLMLTVISIKG